MSITLTKGNFVEMLPQLYTMLNTYASVYVEPKSNDTNTLSHNEALEMLDAGEFISMPNEATNSIEAFSKFIDDNA